MSSTRYIFALLIIALITGSSSADDEEVNCRVMIPKNPLSANGLATPHQVFGDGCKMSELPSFVECTIFNTKSFELSVYNPLVIDKGTEPAASPVVPHLGKCDVVGCWFGTNANSITLVNPDDDDKALEKANCVNGLGDSIFGQFAACNAQVFFAAVKKAGRHVKVPPLGTGRNGKTCYTTRSFEVVDQDQSDNVIASYLLLPNNQTAQATKTNKARFNDSVEISNGSDELLLDKFLRPALGCEQIVADDLTDPGSKKSSLALQEIQARKYQNNPIALVPSFDPMVTIDGALSRQKMNLYRANVFQPQDRTRSLRKYNRFYCEHMLAETAHSILEDKPYTQKFISPSNAVAVNLFTFLIQRFAAAFGQELNCTGLLNIDPPIVPVSQNGVTIDGVFNF
ncbi:hypothetical protein SeLEV6574_g08053 [Synchytrium endobioticum]|nr:hypothetical protein SeLEV6574_g08053 [Synchytrium endobioticum]